MTTRYATSHEHHQLGRIIERIDTLTVQMTTPRTPQDLPSLAKSLYRLSELAQLVMDLSDKALLDRTNDIPPIQRLVTTYARATASAGRATSLYAEACADHHFLHQHAGARETPDLLDVREHAFAAVQERIQEAARELAEASNTLSSAADRLRPRPLNLRAALSRSARSAPCTDCVPGATAPDHRPAVPQEGPYRAR
jgi:hypothetical protein